jgi:iron complex outermembrane receptor protein
MEYRTSRGALALISGLMLWGSPLVLHGQNRETERDSPRSLRNMTLQELSKIEVTTVSKESTEAFRIPAAINVLTREDIARSGATSIPDLLRLLPGVEVAQIAADKWAIGIRGFQGYLSSLSLS